MNLLSERRGSRLGKVAITAASLVVVACSGAATTQSVPGPGGNGDGGASTGPASGSGSGGSGSGGSGSGSSSGSGSGSSSGSSSGSGSGGSSSGSGSGSVTPGDGGACSATGSEVVWIGDSYPVQNNGEIATHVESLATTAGALAQGSTYRTYYVGGTNMVGGFVTPNIPDQFKQAVAANPDIKYVIMDGGGNDVLISNNACITTQPPPASQSCVTTVNNAVDAAKTLFGSMKTAGVKSVIYYFYPHLPTNGKQYVNDTLDYAYPLVKTACDSAATTSIPCFFVDTRASFEGHPEYIGPDGIHPTPAGSDVIAGLIWGAMKQQCIAQ